MKAKYQLRVTLNGKQKSIPISPLFESEDSLEGFSSPKETTYSLIKDLYRVVGSLLTQRPFKTERNQDTLSWQPSGTECVVCCLSPVEGNPSICFSGEDVFGNMWQVVEVS